MDRKERKTLEDMGLLFPSVVTNRNRQTHEIKLDYEFQDAVLSGEKSFEVRYNDRGYQKGDLVKFHVNNKKNVVEPLDSKVYEITYVLSGWHIEPGYVVFGIKEATDV